MPGRKRRNHWPTTNKQWLASMVVQRAALLDTLASLLLALAGPRATQLGPLLFACAPIDQPPA